MSSSIFQLKTKESQLASANMGVSRQEYQQVTPTRDIAGDKFTNGRIHYRFTLNGIRW